MNTSHKQLSGLAKTVLMSLLLLTAGISRAQKMAVTFDAPQEEPKKWSKTYWHDAMNLSILSWNNDNIVVYSFSQQLYLARIDKNFNILESSTTKIGESRLLDDYLLRIWHKEDSIYAVTREGSDIYLHSFDTNTLQHQKARLIYTISKHAWSLMATPVDIKWARNNEYIALVVRHIPKRSKLGKEKVLHEFCLYDRNFNPIGSGIFDPIEFPTLPGLGFGYASSWTLTDNGEIVFASLKAARKPKKYPEFGATATQMEIGLFRDGKLTTYSVPNVYRGNLPVGTQNSIEGIDEHEDPNHVSMSLKTGSIMGYDGKTMMLYFLNTLYRYSFQDNTVTPLIAMPFCLEPTYNSSGMSSVIDDEDGGYIIYGGSGFAWIPRDVNKSFVGNWGGARKFLNWRTSAQTTQSLTFLYNGRLYHVADVERYTSYIIGGKQEHLEPQLISVDKDRKMDACNLDAAGFYYFYRVSDNRLVLWQRNLKVDGKKCQRFGFVDLP